MDINEVTEKKINRHPWELSRTWCLFKEWKPYIDELGDKCEFIDLGAGDLFFDKYVLRRKKEHFVHAVDIGYGTEKNKLVHPDSVRIRMYTEMSDLPGDLKVEYAMMLDSIEYMEDEVECIKDLASHVKDGGYLFFSMVAFQSLFTRHDLIVKLLRRYSRKEFEEIIMQVPGISIVKSHYFFNTLFVIRFLQKKLNMKIDPYEKVTTGWKYSERHLFTKLVKGFLKIDYMICEKFAKVGVIIPGLSLMVICKKDKE